MSVSSPQTSFRQPSSCYLVFVESRFPYKTLDPAVLEMANQVYESPFGRSQTTPGEAQFNEGLGIAEVLNDLPDKMGVENLVARRDGRVAEGARLESVYTLTGIGGSNPSLSARFSRSEGR
jgi:hypothetical protein